MQGSRRRLKIAYTIILLLKSRKYTDLKLSDTKLGTKTFGPIFGIFRTFLPVNFGQMTTP